MRIDHRQFGLDGFQPDKAPDTLPVGAVSGGQTTVQTGDGNLDVTSSKNTLEKLLDAVPDRFTLVVERLL